MGIIHRTMIMKIHGTRNNTVSRSPPADQNNIYLEDFVHETNLDLERVSRYTYATEDGGSARDIKGRRVFIGDLVHTFDVNHDYNEWIVMVNGISPGGLLHCMLGIPPGRMR